jgi:hypothetical protein
MDRRITGSLNLLSKAFSYFVFRSGSRLLPFFHFTRLRRKFPNRRRRSVLGKSPFACRRWNREREMEIGMLEDFEERLEIFVIIRIISGDFRMKNSEVEELYGKL